MCLAAHLPLPKLMCMSLEAPGLYMSRGGDTPLASGMLNRNCSPLLAIDTDEWDRSRLHRPYSVKQIGPTSYRLIVPTL